MVVTGYGRHLFSRLQKHLTPLPENSSRVQIMQAQMRNGDHRSRGRDLLVTESLTEHFELQIRMVVLISVFISLSVERLGP